ncbi:hypothetical protein HMPREF1547_03145 [Blautia sp. KLE 1732]|nr:hypothetical protein HMPREF1547_03145 [Blautia sp. KLE 1732]
MSAITKSCYNRFSLLQQLCFPTFGMDLLYYKFFSLSTPSDNFTAFLYQ